MAQPKAGWTDEQMDQVVGNLLRTGVILAAAVVFAGGVLYLVRYGKDPADDRRPKPEYLAVLASSPQGVFPANLAWAPLILSCDNPPHTYRVFRGEPADLRTPGGIVADVLKGSSRGLIQLGLLLLIATPVARVILSVFAFAGQRDFTYVVVTLIVLAVLLYSLFSGHLGS